MPKRKTHSQRDIAVAAGVSQAAVSFVLNGRATEQGISAVTQERVRAAIEELGYVPNPAAQSLRGGRNHLIGVHTFEQVFPVHADDYYREFLNGIEEQATATGMDLVLFASTRQPDGSRAIYGRGTNRLRIADGAVIFGFQKDENELRRLAEEGYPFVLIGRTDITGLQVPYVTADYRAITGRVVEMLTSHGHDKVLYIGDVVRGPAKDERLAAFRATSPAHSNPDAIRLLTPTELDGDWVQNVIEQGFTAVVAEGSELTIALLDALTARPRWSPRELSVVSLDAGSERLGLPDVSHVGIPRRAMGRRAVDLLLAVIDGSATPDAIETLSCTMPGFATVANRRTDVPVSVP